MAIRLNKAQEEAVKHDLGPLLVLAGAGSGKTGVVTRRIARLIKSGVPARAILAVTFTNKAAGEMKERVVKLTGKKASRGLILSTFHRFGLDVLSRETKAIGFRGGSFAIFDRGDSMGVLRDAMRRVDTGKNYDIGAILNRISLAKNAFIDPETFKEVARDDPYDAITAEVYPRYDDALRSLQAFDFDDLVCEPVRLWRRRPDVLERWKLRFRYVIVDEYQDTNLAQLEMLRMLVVDHKNLCVVGDDAQSIYAWRGADVRNILDFDKQFRGAKVVRLERNYRSTAAILNVANAVLAASEARRHEKTLIPTQGEGEIVKVVEAPDGSNEARFVAETIHELTRSGLKRPGDFACLYRSNLQAPELEAELKIRGVPYRLSGGTQTFERKEVKDVVAYLKVAIAPGDELATRRSLNYPPRGIGGVALKRIAGHATAYDLTLYDAVAKAHGVAGLSPAAAGGARHYVRIIENIRSGIDEGLPANEVVEKLVADIGLKDVLWAESGKNNKAAGRRWANIKYLVGTFARRHAKGAMDRAAWVAFLRAIMLRETEEQAEANNAVTLTTIHGSKGLEFDTVFVVGVEEGLLPHTRTTEDRTTDSLPLLGQSSDDVEQERRLFYVAITRAKRNLYLCHAATRPQRGKMQKRVPSRFLLQVPEDLIEKTLVTDPGAPSPDVTITGAGDVLAALLGK